MSNSTVIAGTVMGRVTVTLATPCDHCAQPVPINGPEQALVCPHCLKETPVPHLYEILCFAAAEARTTSEYQYTWFDDPSPECPSCGKLVPVDHGRLERADAAASIACACGAAIPTYPAPNWLKQQLPTAVQVFGGDADLARAHGVELHADEHARTPIVLACPACGGGLSVTPASDRTITCSFCSASVFVPDELWKRLHPAKTMLRWTLTYTGKLSTPKLELWQGAQAKLEAARAEVAGAINTTPAPAAASGSDDTGTRPKAGKRIGFIVVSWIAFMLAIAGNGCIGGTTRLAAPFACPSGYSKSVVVLHVGGTQNGGTSYASSLWCVFADRARAPAPVGVIKVMIIQFLEYLLAGNVLLVLLRVRRRSS